MTELGTGVPKHAKRIDHWEQCVGEREASCPVSEGKYAMMHYQRLLAPKKRDVEAEPWLSCKRGQGLVSRSQHTPACQEKTVTTVGVSLRPCPSLSSTVTLCHNYSVGIAPSVAALMSETDTCARLVHARTVSLLACENGTVFFDPHGHFS